MSYTKLACELRQSDEDAFQRMRTLPDYGYHSVCRFGGKLYLKAYIGTKSRSFYLVSEATGRHITLSKWDMSETPYLMGAVEKSWKLILDLGKNHADK